MKLIKMMKVKYLNKKMAAFILICFIVLTLPVSWMWVNKTTNYYVLTKSIKAALNNNVEAICNEQLKIKNVKILRVLYYFKDMGLETIITLEDSKEIEFFSENNSHGEGYIIFQKSHLCNNNINQNSIIVFDFDKSDFRTYDNEIQVSDSNDTDIQIDIDSITWHPIVKSYSVIYFTAMTVLCLIITLVWRSKNKKGK